MRLYLAAGVAAALAASHGAAWWHGRASERDRWQARFAEAQRAADRAEGRAAALADAVERERMAAEGRIAALLAEVDAMSGGEDVALPENFMRMVREAGR